MSKNELIEKQTNNLCELADRVESGSPFEPYELGVVLSMATGVINASHLINSLAEARLGSLDAAKALHDSVLPRWKRQVYELGRSRIFRVEMQQREEKEYKEYPWPDAQSESEAAWVAAILRAKAWEIEND